MSEAPIRVLLVEDDPDDHVIVDDLLREVSDHAYELTSVSSYDEGLTRIMAGEHDVALIDYFLDGGRDGLELLEAARRGGVRVPAILLTGQDDPQVDRDALAAGADDFLEKGTFDCRLLDRAIRYSISHRRTLNALRSSEERLRHAAHHDALTDLPNRRLFGERLERMFERAHHLHHSNAFGVLFIDLDRFKVINDSLGHLVGDELLVAIARRLEKSVRPEDLVARTGGDEFAVLLYSVTDRDDAVMVAERVQTALSAPFDLSRKVFTSASIGIAIGPAEYGTALELLRDADTAMYRAKARGPGKLTVFELEMHEEMVARFDLETELREALEKEEFQLLYQPIFSLDTREICGAEALLRWQHAKHGVIEPLEFISLAEENGLIVPIGEWVMREACREAIEVRKLAGANGRFSMHVNLAWRQIVHPGFIERTEELLRTADPGQIHLEITESTLIQEPEVVARNLDRLASQGVNIVLDDFGTGYSWLRSLALLPISGLKIDRSFIRSIDAPGNREIVRTIVRLSQSLGLRLVAEGVETSEQLGELVLLGADAAQGYYLGRPMSGDKLREFVLEHASRRPRKRAAG